jgi:hypothetical protein
VCRQPASRQYAFSFIGTRDFRKPTREDMHDAMITNWDSITSVLESSSWGADGHLLDWPAVAEEEYSYYDSGLSYLEVMAQTALALVPAGDCFDGGRLYQAIELGCIPVLEGISDFKVRPLGGGVGTGHSGVSCCRAQRIA